MLTPSEFRMIPLVGEIVIILLLMLAVVVLTLRYMDELMAALMWLEKIAKKGKR